MLPEYDQSKLAKVVTGDETRTQYFEPVQKQSNTIRATRICK